MANTQQPGIFHESQTGLTMRFPVELHIRDDAQRAIDEGHVAVFGSMEVEGEEHEHSRRCMKPLLLGELPSQTSGGGPVASSNEATLFLFEFVLSKECKADYKYKKDEAVAGGVAQTAIKMPGATPLSPPLWLDCGKQKLHISFAAIGMKNTSPDQPHQLIATAAMLYHGHLLAWMMAATHLNTFNDLTKTSIELDDGKVYPLVPFNLDDNLHLPINPVK
jgi:hypothetical protein